MTDITAEDVARSLALDEEEERRRKNRLNEAEW